MFAYSYRLDNAASHVMLRSVVESSPFNDLPHKMALKLDPFLSHEQRPKAPTDPPEVGNTRQSLNAPIDKSTLKVFLENGGFNNVKFGDATDIKVSKKYVHFEPRLVKMRRGKAI